MTLKFAPQVVRQAARIKRPIISSSYRLLVPAAATSRLFHTSNTAQASNNAAQRSTPRKARNLNNPDRGPTSREDTQTDFGALNVFGSAPPPSTSVDTCSFDGFDLDSGLKVHDGNGVILVGGEAFVWRPWMHNSLSSGAGVVNGADLRGAHGMGVTEDQSKTAGIINAKGQFELDGDAVGLLSALWPRPDILILGTGPSIRPLAPATRSQLQELGMKLEILDTRNAASQFNLLATERGVAEVAAALVPIGFGQ